MQIRFLGAAGEVTGSKHLITLKNGKTLLLDCGLFQGRGADSAKKNQHLGFDPGNIDYAFLSHAHIDHSGLIPALTSQGFKGKIFCTPATFDLCKIMLADSAYIQSSEAEYINRKRVAEGRKPIKPLYDMFDVSAAWARFHPIPYDRDAVIDDDISVCFTDAGHILGSAIVNLTITENGKKHRVAYTGDVGRYINKVLKKPQPFPPADTLICESTYGNRSHESVKLAREKLKQAVHETCYAKGGKLVIPAFSIGKTQELVYTLNKFEFAGELPRIKVFVDSPLAIKATEVMKSHPECFGEATLRFIEKDPDPFGFETLHYVTDAIKSKQINDLKEPCIIISASGMADAGRVKHHLAATLEDERNSVLIVGYSEPSSLSGRLANGDRQVRIYGKEYGVKANIYHIDFFSAHADANELLRFLDCQDRKKLRNIFLVHGHKGALQTFKQQLEQKGYDGVTIAKRGQNYYV